METSVGAVWPEAARLVRSAITAAGESALGGDEDVALDLRSEIVEDLRNYVCDRPDGLERVAALVFAGAAETVMALVDLTAAEASGYDSMVARWFAKHPIRDVPPMPDDGED